MEEELLKVFDLQLEMAEQNLMVSKQILELLSQKSESDGKPSLSDLLTNIDNRLRMIESKLNVIHQSMPAIEIVALEQEFMYQNEEKVLNENLKLVANSMYSEDDISEEEEGINSWDS